MSLYPVFCRGLFCLSTYHSSVGLLISPYFFGIFKCSFCITALAHMLNKPANPHAWVAMYMALYFLQHQSYQSCKYRNSQLSVHHALSADRHLMERPRMISHKIKIFLAHLCIRSERQSVPKHDKMPPRG